jgi:hypothetical protein
LIISGDELIVDGPRQLGDLVEGIGRFHLPLPAQQLAGLHHRNERNGGNGDG